METRLDQSTAGGQVRLPRIGISADQETLTRVFQSQRTRLFCAALRLLGNAEDAEDAVQEGLLSAIRHLNHFEGRARLSTWLTRIVVNAALMRLRRARGRKLEPIDAPGAQQDRAPLSELLVDRSPNPEEVCLQRERRRIVNQGLNRLSRPHREVLFLHDLNGMTSRETAQVLGLSEGTVKSQVHRARRRLLQQIRGIQQSAALASPART